MPDERWQQIETLYHAALEREPEARAAFLDEACAGDAELRHEVDSLLAFDEPAAHFIAQPAVGFAAQAFAEEQSTMQLGQRISHYQLLSRLGKGGMGEVFLAQDTSLKRQVALKLLPKQFTADTERVQRFEREARAASALNHPNILTIHEIGRTDEMHFIVTEHIDGQTLRQQMKAMRMSLPAALDIAIQIANALAAAHAAGIIHRDIKPENVMVRQDGIVKVLDFGLAKLVEMRNADFGMRNEEAETLRISECGLRNEDADTLVQDPPHNPQSAIPNLQSENPQSPIPNPHSTMPGIVMGTPRYMSPEQARGQKVDARTDIFSFGIMLYEMLAGRRPFEGATMSDVMAAILTAEPVSLSQHLPEASSELERVVGKCLAKDRAARYQSAGELIAELKSLQSGSQAAVAATSRPIEALGARFARWRWPVVAALAAVLMVGLVWLLVWRRAPAVQQIKSLAVLPLENLSGDPAQEYFADGMTDALIGDLAKIGALHVISRTSAMHYKGTKKSLPEIARELGVDAVIEGTVQRSGDRVLIRAQLIHAATDRHLWTETYERDLRDVLKLQSEVAQTIARQIQTKFTPAEQSLLAHNRSVNRKALDDYLQGRYLYWNKRSTENLEKAIEYFQSAIREDPAYAQAYVGVADCYNQLGSVRYSALLPREARRRAEEAAGKALEFDSELAEAHVALGFAKHYNWDWAAAEAEFKRAIELNPNYADAHIRYAQYLGSRGRVEAALAEANRARELDPFSLEISAQRGFVLANARRYPEAIEQLRSIIAMDPNNYSAHYFLGHTYAANGQFEEAIAASEKAASLSDRGPGALGFLGLVYALAGRKDEANKVLNELLELNRRRYVTPAAVASVYIGLGDKDQAFVWLEKAFQERSNFMVFLKVRPLLDPLRSDPRFDDLLRRIGLAP